MNSANRKLRDIIYKYFLSHVYYNDGNKFYENGYYWKW